MTNLPDKSGNYYWREKDGDEWRIIQVELSMLNNEPEVNGMCCESPLSGEYVHVSEIDGEWLPIPTADELVELKACKKMVDEGQVAYAVYDDIGALVSVDGDSEDDAWQWACNLMECSQTTLERKDYTCEPVTIVRKVKR